MKNILVLFCILLMGCSCGKKTTNTHTKDNLMRMCISTDPATIDPRRNGDFWSSTINFLIYEGLTRILPNGEAEQALAKKIDISEDGRIYTFHLRKAFWSDGTPLTAYDFEHTWKTSVDPKFGAACPYLLYPIKNVEKAIHGEASPDSVGIHAIDQHTLRIELEQPTPYFLSLITFCNFYAIPKHIELKNPKWDHENADGLVFSGPFKIKKWVRNKEIILEKNQEYWNAANVLLDRIHIYIIPDERTALRMFENSEVDFISTIIMPISIDDLAALKKTGKLHVIPVAGYLACTFNMTRYPFDNENIRKAFSYAIDRDSIINNITQLSERPATSIIPPVMSNHRDRKLQPTYAPDLARESFKKGLKELGLSSAQFNALTDALILNYRNSEFYRRIAQAIQNQWKQVLGVNVKLEELEYKTLLQNMMRKNYSIGMENAIAQYADPISILERFKYKTTMKNYAGFENPEYIQLLNRASTIKDPKSRQKVLDEAESLLASAMPFTPLFYMQQGVLASPNITNLQFSPLSNLLFTKLIPNEKSNEAKN